MTDDRTDGVLRALFARLREDDQASSPSFEKIVGGADRAARSRTPSRSRRYTVAGALVIAIVAATASGYALMRHAQIAGRLPPGGAQYRPDMSAAEWTSPTDFLLAAPGSRLLRSIPAFGWTEEWSGVPSRPRPGGAINTPSKTDKRIS